MNRTNAVPGPNMLDNGAGSKPMLNPQPENNARLTEQNIRQNTISAASEANVDTVRRLETQEVQVSDQEVKAQQFARERIAEALYANDAGSAMMQLNAISQSPDNAAFLNDIAVSKAMSVGVNPDLAAASAQASMYG